MKHLSTIFLVLVSCAVSHAQGFRWQGIVKDANGMVVTQPVTLTFSILLNDSIVYVETKPPITPVAGQIATIVGDGIATQGSFSTIDWFIGEYSLNVKMKVGNGSEINMDTSRILIPPYLQSFSGSGGSSVGFLYLKNSGEGAFKIPGGVSTETRWIISTTSFSGNFEETFNAIPQASGTVREFYLGIVLDINGYSGGGGGPDCLYDDTVPISELPQIALDYIAANYIGLTIQIVTINNNGRFAALLSNGIVLIFREDGEFFDVCVDNPCLFDDIVSVANLPQIVLDYIAANYIGLTIQIVTVHNNGRFAVLLSNGIVLIFRQDGEFDEVCDPPGNQEICPEKLNVRFYFPEIEALGHQDTVTISWDDDAFGQIKWLKVPSPISQFPNATNLSCRIEVGIGGDCHGSIIIKNFVLTAIDKINGSQPAINVSSELGTQETPTHVIGGLSSRIAIRTNDVYIQGILTTSNLSASTITTSNLSATSNITTSNIDVGSGGISSIGATN